MTWRLVVVSVAAAALVVPIPASFVERYYSAGLFPLIQPITTSASSRTGVSWLDLLIAVVAICVIWASMRDFRRLSAWRAAARVVARAVTTAAVVYLAFLVMWGLNYRREPLRRKIPYDTARISPESALALARETVAMVNGLHAEAHAEGWIGLYEVDPQLASSFRTTVQNLGLTGGFRPGRPKYSLLDLYFRRAGVAGMTDPFFLETLVSSDTLPFERPQVVAHEWAHLAGIADEGEANFVGWLTCVRAGVPHRYSGWLFLFNEVVSGLPRAEAGELSASLSDGPRADLQAIRERQQREVSPALSMAGWRAYDSYLRANRVDAGTASYGQVVQLVLASGLR